MECQTVQEEILDSFEEPRASLIQREIDAHLADCPTCARFAVCQKTVEAQLSAMLIPPEMSSAFRSVLLKTIRRERMRFWSEALPDIVHFVSCAGATVLCAILLPFGTAVIFGAGTVAALLTYVLLTMVRDSLQDVEKPDQ
jgi:predicted anti-sigma-YlaC factor YlaD